MHAFRKQWNITTLCVKFLLGYWPVTDLYFESCPVKVYFVKSICVKVRHIKKCKSFQRVCLLSVQQGLTWDPLRGWRVHGTLRHNANLKILGLHLYPLFLPSRISNNQVFFISGSAYLKICLLCLPCIYSCMYL